MTKSVPDGLESRGKLLEALDAQHQPEVRHRHVVPVDRVGAGHGAAVVVDLVGDDLVALHVPVGPPFGGAAAAEAEDVTVEVPGGLDVVDREGQVEGGRGGGGGQS